MADPMRVAISGSSGLLGGALRDHLTAAGHDVVAIVRQRPPAGSRDVYWSVEEDTVDTDALVGVDAVVHLAGEPLGAKRWTDEQKARIRDSRVLGTRLLATALAGMTGGPRVLVQGSAIGYYGSRGDELLPETATAGDDFLARVVVDWEAAAQPAVDAGLRVAYARTGVVIAEHGDLIDKVRLPFKAGVGGVIGDGSQWVPWVSLEDEVRALTFLLTNDISGPVNIVAPSAVTNRTLTKAIGAAVRRPTFIPTPTFGIRALYGEMGVTLATSSTRVVPAVLTAAGFTWHDTDISGPLAEALA